MKDPNRLDNPVVVNFGDGAVRQATKDEIREARLRPVTGYSRDESGRTVVRETTEGELADEANQAPADAPPRTAPPPA